MQVGLPDDELFRRVRVHRGVYGKWEDTAPKGHTLFHLTPAQFFQGQLPIGRGQDAYVSEDFHHVGAVEAFMNPDDLLAHANAHYAERAGYFYVLQIDTSALTDISENGGEEAYSMDDGDEHGRRQVRVHQRGRQRGGDPENIRRRAGARDASGGEVHGRVAADGAADAEDSEEGVRDSRGRRAGGRSFVGVGFFPSASALGCS